MLCDCLSGWVGRKLISKLCNPHTLFIVQYGNRTHNHDKGNYMTEETSYYLERLREEGYTHDQVLEELDDLVQSGRMSKELHSILLSALEVAGD